MLLLSVHYFNSVMLRGGGVRTNVIMMLNIFREGMPTHLPFFNVICTHDTMGSLVIVVMLQKV